MLLSRFVRQRLVSFINNENSKDLQTIAGLMGTGQPVPVIDWVCPLAALPEAMRDFETGKVRGKVVVKP